MPLLALISVKDWIYIGVIGLLIGGGLWYHHKVYEEGIAKQVAADKVASAKIEAQAVAQTAALQQKADTAEQAHAKEIADLNAQLASAPIEPVRLCVTHYSGGGLPQAGAAPAKPQSASAAPAAVQQMPEGNHSGGGGAAGPDISSMLSLLAFQADSVSSELRELQSR
jgi:hypothetical protein